MIRVLCIQKKYIKPLFVFKKKLFIFASMNINFFLQDNKSGYKSKKEWFMKNHPDEYVKIQEYCSRFIDLNLSFKESIWFYYNNLTKRPS
ncbi:MAG: hypothetical protein RLY43_1716, partial [Bacteroidota bacterium]